MKPGDTIMLRLSPLGMPVVLTFRRARKPGRCHFCKRAIAEGELRASWYAGECACQECAQSREAVASS